ncbi:hypothetical protein MTO96_049288 [Rhipicephalus appendiculatus]
MLQQPRRKQSISTLPCARAARHRTPKGIPLPLVQSPVLPRSLRLLCATSFLPSPGHAIGQAPKMQVPWSQGCRHLTTTSHVSQMWLKAAETIASRAKHMGSFTPALPTYLRV